MLDSGLTEQEMVNQEFEELYPGKIHSTQIVYNGKVVTTKMCNLWSVNFFNILVPSKFMQQSALHVICQLSPMLQHTWAAFAVDYVFVHPQWPLP